MERALWAKLLTMLIQLCVTIKVDKIEEQDTADFLKHDASAMPKYLKEKIKNALEDSWQYNAKVTKVNIIKL